MNSEILTPSPTRTNSPSSGTSASQFERIEGSSIEISTSPPIVVNIPSDSIAIIVLGLICLLVWMVKRPTT